MGAQNAYACDGPKCSELTTKDKGTRMPIGWVRLTLKDAGSDDGKSAAFHDVGCAHAWLDQQLGVEPATTAPATPGGKPA